MNVKGLYMIFEFCRVLDAFRQHFLGYFCSISLTRTLIKYLVLSRLHICTRPMSLCQYYFLISVSIVQTNECTIEVDKADQSAKGALCNSKIVKSTLGTLLG